MVVVVRSGGLAMLLVVLSSATLVAGAVAQSAGSASDGFTGQAGYGSCEESAGTFEIVNEVQQVRGYQCQAGWIGTTDPRFTGTYTSVANIDTYRGADIAPPEGAFNVWTVVRRVENDEGAWQGAATTAAWVNDSDAWFVADPPAVVVFTGEGEYEGLTAIVTIQERIVPSGVRGYIFEGSPPPVPSLEPR